MLIPDKINNNLLIPSKKNVYEERVKSFEHFQTQGDILTKTGFCSLI